jgi:hypothetical protein
MLHAIAIKVETNNLPRLTNPERLRKRGTKRVDRADYTPGIEEPDRGVRRGQIEPYSVTRVVDPGGLAVLVYRQQTVNIGERVAEVALPM